MKLAEIARTAQALHLTPLGGFHEDDTTTILLGPDEPGFWGYVSARPEFRMGGDHPLDHWSRWAITALGHVMGAEPFLPFGGPPYHPFIAWALRSGEAWQSPVGLLVHKDAGLLVSYRGALRFDGLIDLPAPAQSPCKTCTDRPCLAACPVGALGPEGYDVPRCKSHLTNGGPCRSGCAVRLTPSMCPR